MQLPAYESRAREEIWNKLDGGKKHNERNLGKHLRKKMQLDKIILEIK